MFKLRDIHRSLKEKILDYQEVRICHVVIYVNSFCNAKCKMCDIGQKSGKGIDRLRSSEKYLSLDTLSIVLNDPILDGKKVTFSLLMTEPLLSPNIFEIISLIKKHGHIVDLTTNGILLPDMADCLVDSGLDSIQVSLDGSPAVHDLIVGIKGAYQKATCGIKKLNQKAVNSKRNLKIRINYTVTNLNYQYLESFANIIDKDLKIDLLKFQFMDFVSEEMENLHNKIYYIKQTESSLSKEIDPELVDIDVLAKQINNNCLHGWLKCPTTYCSFFI
ncbi:MAG: radical SAM protein [Candidatus Scalindua sp.]